MGMTANCCDRDWASSCASVAALTSVIAATSLAPEDSGQDFVQPGHIIGKIRAAFI
jgi:hypothetical protein